MEKYTRIKQLGKGSFGAAFLVKRTKDSSLFVVKEVSLLKMSAKEKEEARHEVRVLSQLSHPNITQYTEHVERNGVLSIVMEYADGGDLYQRIKASAAAKYARRPAGNNNNINHKADDDQYAGMLQRRGPGASGMSEDLMMHYFAQICLALDYLHSKHILHRDIKSMNVFLTSRGTVKVGDFGISTVLRNTIGMAKTVCGTPYYFSPELCRSKPYNNKSDVWALGVVLYEMANVKHPFDASSMTALMQRICKGAYVPLPAAPANNPSLGFSKGFIALIARCLDVNVGTRYNIKQVLGTDILRQALARLEKDLMLATVCKVRLQTVIGHFDQRDQAPSAQAQGILPGLAKASPAPTPVANPSAYPNAKLAPKPSPSQPIPIPIPVGPSRAAGGGVQLKSEAMQVQKEIDKVDKLIAYLKQPTPGGGPYRPAVPGAAPSNASPRSSPSSVAITPRDREDATQDYIRKHQELQQIMAAHKKKVEDNLRRRQEQEEAYQREALAKRHQYQMDHRPKPSAAKPSAVPVTSSPQAVPLPPKPEAARLPPIAKPSPTAANCLPSAALPAEKRDRHAIAAEAWVAEQRKQDARKKAAADEKRARGRKPSEEQGRGGGALGDVQGMGDYFDRRRREQDDRDSLAKGKEGGAPVGRADMPAGVQARRQLMGDDARRSPSLSTAADARSNSPSAMNPPPRSGSPQPVQPQQPPQPSNRPKSLSPLAVGGKVPTEPSGAKPVDRRPSMGRQPSSQPLQQQAAPSVPVTPRELPAMDAARLPHHAGRPVVPSRLVEEHVRNIEGQLHALEARRAQEAPPRRPSPSRGAHEAVPMPPAAPSTDLGQLLQSFTRREGSSAPQQHGALPPLVNRTNGPSVGRSATPPTVTSTEVPVEGEEDEVDEEVAQGIRAHDYGNMLKHIQGLNVMLVEVDRRRQHQLEGAGRQRHAVSRSDEEVVTEVCAKPNPPTLDARAVDGDGNVVDGDTFEEEEVIDTSCYIGRKGGSSKGSDSDSSDSNNSSFSETEVDTILDATVRGAVSTTDFTDVEPLTPSRARSKGARAAGGGKAVAPLSFGDEAPLPSQPANASPNFDNAPQCSDSSFFRLAHLCGAHFDGHCPVLLNGEEVGLGLGPLAPAEGGCMERGIAARVSTALERYIVTERIAAALSEEAVTPKDKPQEGPRYRKEAASFIALILSRLLGSIGEDEEDGDQTPIVDELRDQRDDAALESARRLIQLLLEASAGAAGGNLPRGSVHPSVALTGLLSLCRKGVEPVPPLVDDRRALDRCPPSEVPALLKASDTYVWAVCKAVTDATSSSGPRSVAVPVEGEDGYYADDINEMVALVSQLLYFRSLC